ncbi:hypothetical protein KUCAC02_013618 [Chaenocephalus aceratus]|uniref:Uncharacterized protein n=1 Tax=Chaenocephalus aceratus TaxID=36190 RepID=A0ACB9WBE2_CHAAC|nr:hypothetical protein KUCAC02_013618 [Chaenocephalus aceratus]
MADVFRSLNLIETLKQSIDHNKLSEVKDALEDLLISRINLALIGDQKSIEEIRKTSLEVLRSQGVTMPKVYVVRPSALEKFDFPGLLQDMERDLPEIRAHAVLLALPTLTLQPGHSEKGGI